MSDELLLHLIQDEALTVHEIAVMYHISWYDILHQLDRLGVHNPVCY